MSMWETRGEGNSVPSNPTGWGGAGMMPLVPAFYGTWEGWSLLSGRENAGGMPEGARG